jgi:hypothetical protein
MNAMQEYNSLINEIDAIGSKLGVVLTNESVDVENCAGAGDQHSPEWWACMISSCTMQAGMNAEEAGLDLNSLIGRTIY